MRTTVQVELLQLSTGARGSLAHVGRRVGKRTRYLPRYRTLCGAGPQVSATPMFMPVAGCPRCARVLGVDPDQLLTRDENRRRSGAGL